MYTDKLQYKGNNDNFDQKLKVFYDLCNRAGIPKIARNQAFPTMLRDIALGYYYDNFDSDQPKPLDELCSAFRNYFEGPEYRRRRLALWESLTIETVMKKPENNDKSTHECLRLLISELRSLQHGLDSELRTEKLLRNKLISACQTLPACQYACYKQAENLSSLIEDFQSSITAWEKANPQENNTFFTDRRYYKQTPFSQNDRRTPFYKNTPRTTLLGGVYPGVTHWSQVKRVLWCIYCIVAANPEGSARSAHPRVYIPSGCLRPPQD
jgi:hypothetical protein